MRFSGLSVRQLEAFAATMEAGSVSAAASIMNVSQPSVSRLLKDLEADTGLALFTRRSGRLVPTESGILFYGEVRRTFRSARDLMHTAQEIKQLKQGVVRLQTLAALSFEIIPHAMRRFRHDFPDVLTTVAVRESREIVGSVSAKLTDIGIVDADVPFLDTVCVSTYEINSVCVMDASHPLAEYEAIDLEHLARYPFVSLGADYLRHSPDGARLARAVARNVVADTFQSFLACALVMNSRSLAVVDPFTARFYGHSLLAKPLDLQVPFRIAAIQNQLSTTNLGANKLLEMFAEEISEVGHHPE